MSICTQLSAINNKCAFHTSKWKQQRFKFRYLRGYTIAESLKPSSSQSCWLSHMMSNGFIIYSHNLNVFLVCLFFNLTDFFFLKKINKLHLIN